MLWHRHTPTLINKCLKSLLLLYQTCFPIVPAAEHFKGLLSFLRAQAYALLCPRSLEGLRPVFPTDLKALGLLCVSQKRDSVFLVLHPSVSLGPETAWLFFLRITQTSGVPWLRLGPAKHHQFCLCPHLAKMSCLTSPFTKSCRQIAAAWDHTWESSSSTL